MGRVSMGLRSGAGLLALVIGSAAAAQSTLPPPDVARDPIATACEPAAGGEIVVTGSRIRRDPLSQDAADRVRRPGRHRQDRPQLGQRRAAAPAQLGRRPQRQVQQLRQPRQSARRRRRRRRRGRNRPALPRLAPRARAGRRHPLRERRSACGVPGSTDLNSIPDSAIERIEVLQDGASAIYGSDAIAGVVNIITKKKPGGLRRRRPSSAAMAKATASPRITS